MSEEFHRIRHLNKVFNDDEWADYCRECREDDSKRIRTTIGKYTFNDCDICLNPDTERIESKGGVWGYYVVIKWAECGNGLWSYGLDYSTGTGGGGFGVSWADLLYQDDVKWHWNCGYPSERECKAAASEKAIVYLQRALRYHDGQQVRRLIAMVEDYHKSLTRPQVVQLELF